MNTAQAMAMYADLLMVQRTPANTAHLRLDFSETMRVWSSAEGVNGQALWQLSEFDHTIKFSNFLMKPQAVATASGNGVSIAPTGITVDGAGVATIEDCSDVELSPDGLEESRVEIDPPDWKTWCDRRGLRHRPWTPEQIGATAELRASLDVLYRHVRTCARDRALEAKVVAQLSHERTLQFSELKRRLGGDPQRVASSVARLLMRGGIFGDLNVQPRAPFLSAVQHRSFIVPSGHRFSEVTCLSTANVFSA